MERHYLKSFSIHLRVFIQGSLSSHTSSPSLIPLSKEKSFLKFQFITSGWLHLLWQDDQEMGALRLSSGPTWTCTYHQDLPFPKSTASTHSAERRENKNAVLNPTEMDWRTVSGDVTACAETNVHSEQTAVSTTESSVVSCLFWQRKNGIGN